MSTNVFKSINYNHTPLRLRHSSDSTPATNSFTLKPPVTTAGKSHSLSYTTTFTAYSATTSSTTPTTSTSQTTTFDLLKKHLSEKNFRQADEETRRLIIELAGEAAETRGYVFFSEVKFIQESDLKTIDNLWKEHSEGKFGYSVQKKIWQKSNKDFTKFFIKLGWMKKLVNEDQPDQYNYRAFPNEFIWELDENTPEGHLPLTNALRGIQLLSCILSHSAFGGDDDEEKDGLVVSQSDKEELKNGTKPLSRTFKTSYTF